MNGVKSLKKTIKNTQSKDIVIEILEERDIN